VGLPLPNSVIDPDSSDVTTLATEDHSMNRIRGAGFAAWLAPVLVLLPELVRAQLPPLPAGTLQQLDQAIGQRVEATAVLATQNTVSRIGLGWTLNDADGAIYRIPWKFELHDPRPLGDSRVSWTPVIEGGAGYGAFANHFSQSTLAGNESDFTTVAFSLGAGPRFYFGDSGVSVLPAFDLIYAYTDNNFIARTTLGQIVAADGRYVNWRVQTISFVPSFEARYRRTFGRWTPELTSSFVYFDTQPITQTTDALSFTSDSMAWANKADLDFLTPWNLFGCPMHFGGNYVRTQLYGGLQDAMRTDHFSQVDGRVTFDLLGKVWKVDTLGVSGGYFWCDAFNGYSVGLEGSMKF
jgi:hypothetical protein